MAIAKWSIGKFARNRGSAAGTVIGELVTSGNHTTGGAATVLIANAAAGDVLRIKVEGVDARLNAGGVAATATAGHVAYADETFEWEIPVSGDISIIDA